MKCRSFTTFIKRVEKGRLFSIWLQDRFQMCINSTSDDIQPIVFRSQNTVLLPKYLPSQKTVAMSTFLSSLSLFHLLRPYQELNSLFPRSIHISAKPTFSVTSSNLCCAFTRGPILKHSSLFNSTKIPKPGQHYIHRSLHRGIEILL